MWSFLIYHLVDHSSFKDLKSLRAINKECNQIVTKEWNNCSLSKEIYPQKTMLYAGSCQVCRKMFNGETPYFITVPWDKPPCATYVVCDQWTCIRQVCHNLQIESKRCNYRMVILNEQYENSTFSSLNDSFLGVIDEQGQGRMRSLSNNGFQYNDVNIENQYIINRWVSKFI